MGGPIQQPQPQYVQAPVGPPKGLATAAMVLGIVGLVFSLAGCTWFLGIPLDILAIVFGAVGLAKVKSGQGSGETMAKAGLICGIIGIVVVIAWFVIAFTILQQYYHYPWNYYNSW
jgi:hypothetical protein